MAEASKLLKEMIAAGVAEPVTGMDPIIDTEFRDLLDTQSDVSYEELKKLIQRDGIRDPIVVWKEQNILMDGHNRMKIAKELKLTPPTTHLSFADREEAKQWIIRNQLGRRNLTPARFEYYIGTLYNQAKLTTVEEKVSSKGGPKTDEKLGKEFGVSPKSVRRYAASAKGIDNVEKVRGKLAKQQQLSSKPIYTAEELAVLGQASNATVVAKIADTFDGFKKVAKEKKVVAKQQQQQIAAKATLYNVVLAKPDFDNPGFSVTTEPKPTLDKEAAVYMIVPDERLGDGMDLIRKWGLTYEATLVYYSNKTSPGQWTKIVHTFVLIASKGAMALVQAGKEASSVNLVNGDFEPALVKLIEAYHPNGGYKKLDIRRGVKTTGNWDSITK